MTLHTPLCPVLGFAAFSGTGKTTLLKQLIAILKDKDIRIGLVKHAHHEFDVDKPGKDSYELRKAGATQTLVASGKRWALMTETPEHLGDPHLEDLLGKLDQTQLDLVLVEGFRHVHFPKIELHRAALSQPWLYPDDDSIVAIAADSPLPEQTLLPQLDLNQPALIARFILESILEKEIPAPLSGITHDPVRDESDSTS